MRRGARQALGRRFAEVLNGTRPARAIERAATPVPATTDRTPEPAPVSPLQSDLPLPPPAGLPASEGPPLANSRSIVRPLGAGYQVVPPPESGSSGILMFVLIADAVLLGAAAILVFTSLVPRPLSLVLAGASVGLGGILACMGVAIHGARRRARKTDAGTSRIRVRITRA